jgi:hypothetical protein
MTSRQWFGNDDPQTHPDDLWDGLRDLSQRLAYVIKLAAPSTPILVSGDWGSGKSSLLAATQKALAATGHLTVAFNAWSYEGEGPLLPLLLRALWQQAPKELTSKREAKRSREALLQAAGRLVAQKGPSMAILAGALGLPLLGEALQGFHFLHHFHFLHLFEPLVHGSGHGEHKNGDHEDAVAVVQEEFRWLIERLINKHSGQPVVFFIDDLDRCSPFAALALIESLRILIGGTNGGKEAPEARYVVALDRTTLIRTVQQKFHGMSDYDGNRYLEKIFPLSFHVPQPERAAIMHFVASFFVADKTLPSDTREALKDILCLALANPVFANPRLMRRCTQRFQMYLRFEAASGRAIVGPLDDEHSYKLLFLVKWIAAGERWPTLRRLFARHADDYWLKVKQCLSEPQASSPEVEIEPLLAEQDLVLWLRRELFGTKETRLDAYRNAEEQLSRYGL